MNKLDTFTQAYVECALWASIDEDGEPFDSYATVDDIAPATLSAMVEDCRQFQEAHAADIEGREEEAGHDFWLTRNRHGCGFWDGDWPEEAGKRLTQASKAFGEINLYTGDDGLIYGM